MNETDGSQYLTTTTSTCRDCGRLIPARVHIVDGAVWFQKHCPEHGEQSARVYGNADEYLGLDRFHRAGSVPLEFHTPMEACCPSSCGLCPEHEQHICLPIIEITDHCDLECPICLVSNRSSFHLSRKQVAQMLDRLIAGEGQIDVLNLSGGEPTVNPCFREIVDECVSRKEILRVSVSTNGLNLLRNPELLAFLAERGVVISLQFDALSDDTDRTLRGRPLLSKKLELIDRIGELDAPMTLTATVARGVNEDQLGELVTLLFQRDHILSLMLQPAAYVGNAAQTPRPADPLTIPDITRMLNGADSGRVATGDFTPLPCSHPACFSLAFFLRLDEGGFVSIKQLTEIDRYLDIIQNRSLFGTDPESFDSIREAVCDLWSGPSGTTPDSDRALKAVRRLLESVTASPSGFDPAAAVRLAERSIKSIFIHHFMDRDTFDLARARKCCNVYPLADGRMMPCCVHNCLRR